MNATGQHTFTEITTQTTAWAEAIKAFKAVEGTLKRTWTGLNPTHVLFVGCGSTHYLSQTAAAIFQRLTGLPTRACPSSELILFAPQVLSDPKRTLLVAISRSGTTTETIEAIVHFRRLGGQAVWGISCYPEGNLARSADLILLAEAAQEQSIAQTRSFSSMLILAQALAAVIAGEDISALDHLPELGDRLLEQTAPLAEALGQQADLDRFFFLGSGIRYGLANEVMLKMKEMSLSYSEGFHFLEFRHGPMAMVNAKTLVVGLLSEIAQTYEAAVLSEMAALGGAILAVNAPPQADFQHQIEFGASLPLWISPVLYLPALQLLAYHRAVSKGLDPDAPRNLQAVIHLDDTTFGDA